MTSSELRQIIGDMAIDDQFTRRDWLFTWCLIALVDTFEQIREEMITRMPLLEDKRVQTNHHDLADSPHDLL